MRVTPLRYPTAKIAAGLFAGIALGYCIQRRSPTKRQRLPSPSSSDDLSMADVARFFKLTRRAWKIPVAGL